MEDSRTIPLHRVTHRLCDHGCLSQHGLTHMFLVGILVVEVLLSFQMGHVVDLVLQTNRSWILNPEIIQVAQLIVDYDK